MSDMIKRVEYAIRLADGARRTEYIQHARAAIEAMREPTAAMTVSGGDQLLDGRTPLTRADGDAIAVWRAMIDAALGKEEQK